MCYAQKRFLMKVFENIKNKCIVFGKKFVAFWVKVGLFFYNFPKNFVKFWVTFGRAVANFFRELPTILKSKDKTIDLLVGIGAVIVWSAPIFTIIYVLMWFLPKFK